MEAMGESTGALSSAYSTYLNSIEAHINRFKAAYQSLSQSMINSDLMKGLIDFGTGAINVLSTLFSLLDKIGGAAPLIASIFGGLLTLAAPKIFDSFKGLTAGINGIRKALAEGTRGVKLFTSSIDALSIGIAGATAVATIIITVIASVAQKARELRHDAAQAGQALSSTLSSDKLQSDGYIKRIEELKEKLADSTLSHQDMLQAQQELLSIQDELGDKYGSEAESIRLLSMSAADAAKEIERLNEELAIKEASQYLSKYDKQISDAIKRVENVRQYIAGEVITISQAESTYSDVWDQVKSIIDKYPAAKVGADSFGLYYTLEVTADARHAESTLQGLYDDLYSLKSDLQRDGIDYGPIFDRLFANIQTGFNNIDDYIDDRFDIYNTAVEDKLLKNEYYREFLKSFRDAESEYLSALNGDFKTTEERVKAIAEALVKVKALETSLDDGSLVFGADDKGVEDYLRAAIEKFNESSKLEQIEVDLYTNPAEAAGLREAAQLYAQIADEEGNVTATSIALARTQAQLLAGTDDLTDASYENAKAYTELEAKASEYGLTFEELTNLLVDMGYLHRTEKSYLDGQVKSLITLSDELKGATSALGAYKVAMEGGEKGDIANEYAKVYKQFLADWESGKTGTNAVRAAIELFIPDSIQRSLNYDMQRIGTALASDLYQTIFSEEALKNGDPGVNFANYIREHYTDAMKEIVQITENGDGTFDFAISSYEALASALGMDIDLVHALCDGLDAYGTQIFVSGEDTQKLAESLGILGGSFNTQTEMIQAAIDGLAASGQNAIGIMDALKSLASAGYIDLSQFAGGESALSDAVSTAVKKAKETADQEPEEVITLQVDADDRATAKVEEIKSKAEEIIGDGVTIPISVTDANSDAGGVDASATQDKPAQPVIVPVTADDQFTADLLRILQDAQTMAEGGVQVTVGVGGDMVSLDTLAQKLGLVKENAVNSDAGIKGLIQALQQQYPDADQLQIFTILNRLAEAGYIDLGTLAGDLEGLAGKAATLGEDLDSLGEKNLKPSVTLVDNVSGPLDSLLAAFKSRDNQNITWTVSAKHHTGRIIGFASGTKDAPGGPTLVNEKGPELISEDGQAYIAGGGEPTLVDLHPGATVLTAEETRKTLGGKVQSFFKGIPIRAAAFGIGQSIRKKGDVIEMTDAGTGKNPIAATIKFANTTKKSSGGSQGGGGGGTSNASGGGESWFETQLAEHKHLVEMDKETQKAYLDWLDDAYKRAYKEGIIDLKTYRSKEEEVYKGRQSDFKDHISDTEHMIDMERNGDNSPTVIFNLYSQMLTDIQNELEQAYANGLDSTNEYVQYLQNAWYKYNDEIKNKQDEANDDAKQQVKDLVDYRIKMLKQYIKNEIDALKDRISYLKDFYDKQKKMLQDVYDTEKYLDEQSEKRKSVADIQAELQQLAFDDSAYAQKRKLKLREELASAEKELNDFEKQHALELAQEEIDKAYESQEEDLNARIEELEAKLNNPQYLYETALEDVRNNSIALYEEMIEYNNRWGDGMMETVVAVWEEAYKSLKHYYDLYGEYYKDINLVNATGYTGPTATGTLVVPGRGYASGTSKATPGVHRIEEAGEEYIFQSSNGNRYRMFSGGEKVLNASATDFLYRFASSGGRILQELVSKVQSAGSQMVAPRMAAGPDIRMGDIIIHGNANVKTVSEIRRAQRESVEYMLKEFTRLNR